MLNTDFTRQEFGNILGWAPAPAPGADRVVRLAVVETVGGSDLPLCQVRKDTHILYKAPHSVVGTQFPVAVKGSLQASRLGQKCPATGQ